MAKKDMGNGNAQARKPRIEGENAAGEDMDAMMMRRFVESCRPLGPLVKRHVLPQLPGQPPEVSLGWAQLGRGLSLGLFAGPRRFTQIALADDHGRVFLTADPKADVFDLRAVFQLMRDDEESDTAKAAKHTHGRGQQGSDGRQGRRSPADAAVSALRQAWGRLRAGVVAGGADAAAGERGPVIRGNVLGMDDNDRMVWLASWSRHGREYTLEQLRPELDATLREHLEYRDAIAVAFFAAYLLPRMRGLLIGFGTGNIFRRLRTEAPIGAIRRSARDTLRAGSMGMRVSGLERHFSHLMGEAGAFDRKTGLEAVHGAEPLHLFTSSYSGSFVFAWHGQMAFRQMMTVLRIESGLNRFSQVSAWLERNARLLHAHPELAATGRVVTEDTADMAEVSRIDDALLENPAIAVLDPYAPQGPGTPFDPVRDDGTGAAYALFQQASQRHADGSEWSYRQALASLLRHMRLPYRFDVDFRSNLADGQVAMAFTSAGLTMMPQTRLDPSTGLWNELDDAERARMSADYNLRVGLMFAALAFGVDDHVRDVHLQIDSIGLEEAADAKPDDDSLSQLYAEALRSFGQARGDQDLVGGGKGAPKDGDLHGNPSAQVGAEVDPGVPPREPEDEAQGRPAPDVSDAASSAGHGEGAASGGAAGNASVGDAASASASADATAAGAARGGSAHDSGDARESLAAGGTCPDGQRTEDGEDAPDITDADRRFMDEVDRRFNDMMNGIDLDESVFSLGDEVNDAAGSHGDGGDESVDGSATGLFDALAGGSGAAPDGVDADADSAGKDNPVTRHLVSVHFTRNRFLELLKAHGLADPVAFYREFAAIMWLEEGRGLRPIDAHFDLSDARFAPHGSQEEPELSGDEFDSRAAAVLGTHDAMGLSIQRADILQRAVYDFHRIAAADLPSVEAARQAMDLVHRIADPELNGLSSQVTAALIDGSDTPDLDFTLAKRIDDMRLKTRDMLFGGNPEKAMDYAAEQLEQMDAMFAAVDGVPRYFNSYAERVVYNRLFATPGETTVLIPDNLFYAHMELADILSQISGPNAALPHLTAMVQYAPAYPLAHMRLAVQLARKEDWAGARAATLNALRVSLDGADAAYAYYRYAYAEWMRDEFALAAAGYIMADHVKPGAISALEDELTELLARADSQCIDVPRDPEQAAHVLAEAGVPVWPNTDVLPIVDEAARTAVDAGLFVPARTLSLASARMHGDGEDGLDILQAQFLRSLNA